MKKYVIIAIIMIIISGGAYFLLNKDEPEAIDSLQSTETPATEPEKSAPIPTTTPIPTIHNISIQDFAFNQKIINIKKGDTIIWTNKDSAPHTVTAVTGDNGGPASETLNKNKAFSFTFNNIGTFNYYCVFHPSMTGSVVVTQ